jgi:hypothetical protein
MEKFSLRYLKPRAFIFLCAFLALVFYATNRYVSHQWGASFSVFALLTGFFTLINQYFWNVRPFSWLYSVPDFSGRYEGTLQYQYRNDKAKVITGTLEHIKVIHQNGSDIVIHSWTKKPDGTGSSKSISIQASIVRELDGTFIIIFNYLNKGSSNQGFPPHYGTEVLKPIIQGNKIAIVGEYYTQRLPYQTKGNIDLKFISKKLLHEK